MQSKSEAYKSSRKMSWPWRLLAVALIITVIIGVLMYHLTFEYVIGQAEKSIQDLLLSHKGVHHLIQKNTHPALFSLKELGEIKEDFYSPELLSSSYMVRNMHRYYNEERVKAGLPEIYYKLAAINPRNPVNKASAMEQELIETFNKKRSMKKYRAIIEVEGKKYLYYALPFLENNQACLKCHGDRQAAPRQLQAIYKGEGGFNEKVGNIRAIESIRAPLESEFKLVHMIFVTLLLGLVSLLVMLFISGRLKTAVKLRTADLEQEITERKAAQEKLREKQQELQNHRDHLEDLVKGRTVELEAANKELEDFAYSVSHDLRAPLRSINGFAQIISRRHRADLNEEGRHYFDNIMEASEHMGTLIEDLLRYSRLGRKALRPQSVQLGDLVGQISRDLAGRMDEIGAEIDIPADLPVVKGDPTLLRTIFTNLIDNAITYHRQGVPLRIEVRSKIEKDHVIVSMSDNGIGISPEFLEKIFNMFQRLHRQDEYPGTGIGLAIVKKSAEISGGRVWAESVVGEGSTFYVELRA